MSTLRVAAVQHDIEWLDREANYARLAPMIGQAAGAGAELVLLSETVPTGFTFETPGIGEPFDGPSSQFLRAQADQHGLWVGGSCPEISADNEPGDERPSNTFVLAGPDGTVHRYRKIHPFSFAGEEKHVRPGEQFVTVEVNGLRLSLFVCYDLRFADEFWGRAHDTDAYLVVANWPAARRMHWWSLLRARAIENQAYVVGVNRVGTGGGIEYSGDTAAIDPLGEVLASAAGSETILLADIHSEVVADTRDRFRFLQDRR